LEKLFFVLCYVLGRLLQLAALHFRSEEFNRGAGKPPSLSLIYEKWMVGEPGASGFMLRAEGSSDVSQATADTAALAALNGQPRHRYSGCRRRGAHGVDDLKLVPLRAAVPVGGHPLKAIEASGVRWLACIEPRLDES
jgi:hypothetical protein